MENRGLKYTSQAMYNNLRKLLNEAEPEIVRDEIDEYREAINELRKIHNILVFLQNSFDRSFISVTGLQGSGKTSLINKLYGFEQDLLSENMGRGEVKPVLITEKENITEPMAYEVHLERKGSNIVTTEIPAEDFKNRTMSSADGTLWFELQVPFKLIKDESKSIVLLPGFESEDVHTSQEMLNNILNLSEQAILLIRKDLTANKRNADMINKIKEVYKDVNPLIVMSFCDINPETNENLKKRILEEFDVEENQLILKTDDEQTWIPEFIEKVNNFHEGSYSLEKRRYNQLEDLSKEMKIHMKKVERIIERNVEKEELELNIKSLTNDIVLRKFQDKRDQVLKRIEKDVERSLISVKKDASTQFKEYVDKNETKTKNLKGFFSARALKDSMEDENKINEIWLSVIEENDIEKKVYESATNAILELESEYIQEIEKEKEKSSENKISFKLLGVTDKIHSQNIIENDNLYSESFEKINNYFNRQNSAPDDLTDKDLTVLTIMATVLGRQVLPAEDLIFQADDIVNNPNTEYESGDIKKAEEEAKQKIKTFETNAIANVFMTRTILKNIPIILGVDAAIDGEFNLLTNATESLSAVGISISSKALLGWIGAAVIALKAVETLHVQTIKLNTKKMDLSQKGDIFFNTITKEYGQSLVNIYREIFEKMEDRYVATLNSRLTNKEDYYSMRKILYLTNALKSNVKEFSKEVKNEKLLFEPIVK